MNTLITILVFAAIFLVGVVLAFLAGVYVSKEGVQQIARDMVIQNKKDQVYYDEDDDEEEEEEEQHQQYRKYTPRVVNSPYEIRYYHANATSSTNSSSSNNRNKSPVRRFVGDGHYLKLTQYN